MLPAFHLFLPFKGRVRYSAIVAAATLGSLLGWTFLSAGLDLPKEVGLGVLGALLAVLLGREAIPLSRTGLASRNGLTIDGAGLTMARGVRTASWTWEEISNLKLRSWLHPAGLIFGRFITFRVPADERRKTANSLLQRLFVRGRSVVIADDYPGHAKEMFRQIEHYRDHAAGGVGQQSRASPSEPLWSFRKDRKQPKFLRLLGILAGPFLGIFIAMFFFDGLPESVGDLLESPVLFGMAIGLGSILPWVILVQYRWESKQDNMLAMSAGGLVTRQKIVRRLWRWSDIVDLDVQQSASRAEDGVEARVLSFRATHDGSEPGKKQKDGKPLVLVSCSIEDLHETPIEEIAQRSRAWWDWSNETFGESEAMIAGASSRADAPIAFRRMAGYVKGRGSPLDLMLSFAFVVPMIAYGALIIWMAKAGVDFGFPRWVNDVENFVILIVPLSAYLALLTPGLNRLEFSETGLLSVCYGRKRRWSWHELGLADLRQVHSKWSAKQRAVIVMDAPANGIGSAFLRWAFNIDNRQKAVFEDIYDSSLDEITKALDDRWRRQASRIR